ncbi:MAG: glycosyltransferase [Sphingobacteriaceae bacterium]
MKRILYFFPENPLEKNAGNKIRALSLLEYFKNRGFITDFVSMNKWASPWNADDISAFERSGFALNTFLLNRKPEKSNLLKYLFRYKIREVFFKPFNTRHKALADHVNYYLLSEFNTILKEHHYDYIIISYAYWSGFIANNFLTGNATTIIDTHDFLTAQQKGYQDFRLGAAFEDEINRLNTFDEVWAVSSDEQFLFSQFCKNRVRLVPIMVKRGKTLCYDKNLEIIYVASSNTHNRNAIKWFFDEVYPLIPLIYRICIVGSIVDHVTEYENVTKIRFVTSLDELYARSRIAICPMLTGTGVKVKVVEAFSHGLPVVCNTHGIDGFSNKKDNGCLVSDIPEIFAEHIIALLSNDALYEEQTKFVKTTFDHSFEVDSCYADLDKLLL